MPLSRRSIVLTAAAAGMAAIGGGSRAGMATTDMPLLRATTRTLDINGRAATVLGLVRGDGGHGIILPPDDRFRVRLLNSLAEPTIIHWHGQTPPVEQDGVPDVPMPMLAPGAQRDYDFIPNAGTHWMHAHVPDQEMRLLAAPLIVRTAEDIRADRQEVVLMLHDYSFIRLGEHLARLGGGGAGRGPSGAHGVGGHTGPVAAAMDLNDIDFDAYLANDRTLADPEVVRVEPGGRVLMRIINGASATVFWIDTGILQGAVVAVDGHAVEPNSQGRLDWRWGSGWISCSTFRAGAVRIRSSRCAKALANGRGWCLRQPGPRLHGFRRWRKPHQHPSTARRSCGFTPVTHCWQSALIELSASR